MDLPEEEAHVAKAKAQAGLDALRESEWLRKILSTYEGRAFVWSTLSECGIYADGFCGEETHLAAFISGKRAIGLRLQEKVFTCDKNVYTLMRNEHLDRLLATKQSQEHT